MYGSPPGGELYVLIAMTLGLLIWGYICGSIVHELSKWIIGLLLMFLPLVIVVLLYPRSFSSIRASVIYFTYYAVFAFIGYAYYIFARKRKRK